MAIFDSSAGTVSSIIENWKYPAFAIKKGDLHSANSLFEDLKINPNEIIRNETEIIDKWRVIPVKAGKDYTLYLFFPIDDLIEALNKIEELKNELEAEKKRLKLLVQQAPVSMLILEPKSGNIVFFNNDTIIEICEVDHTTFYSNPNIYNLLKDASKLKDLLLKKSSESKNTPIKVTLLNDKSKWWNTNTSDIEYQQKNLKLLVIEDITLQKEQELKLQEAYQEIQAQNEMLKQHKEELRILNESLSQTNEILQKQKKDLEDSLRYARRVQKKILFPVDKIQESFINYDIGILFYPHTYVSGDFIWVKERDNHIYLAVCDATGHGAAGAIMAMIGNMALNDAFNKINSPQELGKMLKIVQENVVKELNADKEKIFAEGFELAIIAIPRDTKKNSTTVYYSQAKQPFYHYSDELNVIKARTNSIGFVWDYKYDWEYPTKQLTLKENEILYLFTDGIPDQIGKLKNGGTRKLGSKNFKKIIEKIKDYDARTQVDLIKQSIKRWQGDLSQTDDMSLIVLKQK